MRKRPSKRSVACILTVLVVLAGLSLAGCHSGHGAKKAGEGPACPVCEGQTQVAPITGLTHTICVCPVCKNVNALDDATRSKLEAYAGGDVGDTVHVCEKCNVIAECCAACGEQ
jgi:hypothetical protein